VRYGIPVLLALALLALGAMAGVLVVPLARQAAGDPGATVFTLMTPAHAFLGLMILLFAVPLALGLYGMVRRLVRGRGQRWAAVTARCLDRDVQPVVNYDAEGGEEHGWSYRLLCEFELGGDTYRATPDGHDAAEGEGFHLFETPGAAHTFLDAQLDEAGRCRLLVSADDPRRAKLAAEGGHTAEGGQDGQ
jgi:hypothetical protein